MLAIDKRVAIPEKKRSGRASIYPTGAMAVGDSFFVPGKTAEEIAGSIYRNKTRKFTARSVTEKGVKGVRVWRVK